MEWSVKGPDDQQKRLLIRKKVIKRSKIALFRPKLKKIEERERELNLKAILIILIILMAISIIILMVIYDFILNIIMLVILIVILTGRNLFNLPSIPEFWGMFSYPISGT